MSINATTLSAAISATETVFGVASATGITAPVPNTGVGLTYLKVDDEMMQVYAISGTVVSVIRGVQGTRAEAHAASVPVIAGGPSDFENFVPVQGVVASQLPYNFSPIGPPLTGATIAPSGGYIHHFTGTTALVTITLPADLVAGGHITLIFDGSGSGLTWTAAGNIAVAGTSTTAASAVTFFYDPSSAKWHPSRLA